MVQLYGTKFNVEIVTKFIPTFYIGLEHVFGISLCNLFIILLVIHY